MYAGYGQPPFCGTCNKFKKGTCYDNPRSPQRASADNTACRYYNKPPQKYRADTGELITEMIPD